MELYLIDIRDETDGAKTFRFRPAKPFTWTAGQSIKIEVQGPYGPLEHRFSISSAPYEGVVAITTRLSGSAYKNSLAKLKKGDRVKAHSLEGTFVWQESNAPLLLVAAGIGITPFHAMLKQRAHDKQPLSATLIYGSATEDIVFAGDIAEWQKHPEFTVAYVTGRHIKLGDIPEPKEHMVYISGPSLMVDELSASLLASGLPETQLVRDWFTGRLPQLG